MIRNTAVLALHKTGLYQLVDMLRDHAQIGRLTKRTSLSQYGEDIFLQDHFKNRKGFYIDIGANHPVGGSNTYKLYQMGWVGLTVEPIRRFYEKQRRFRPLDIQVNAAVGDVAGSLTFYEMIPSVVSTCDSELAKDTVSNRTGLVLKQYEVPVTTIAELCHRYVAPHTVSLLCVDVEGHDLAVLRGADWDKFRPEIIVAEANEPEKECEIDRFLHGKGYSRVRSFGGSLVYRAP